MAAAAAPLVISGTFAMGWTAELVDALRAALPPTTVVVGAAAFDHPCALLLHRAAALRDDAQASGQHTVIVACFEDIAPKHPVVEALLADLAAVLLPPGLRCRSVVVHADPREYFGRCVAEGLGGTQAELSREARTFLPLSAVPGDTRHAAAPPHLTDTPSLLREFVEYFTTATAAAAAAGET